VHQPRLAPRPAQKSLLQLAHDLGLIGSLVVVAEQVAQAVDGQSSQLAGKSALATAAKCGLDGNDDVAEKDAIAGGVAFAVEILLMETEDIGGPVKLAVVAVERAYLVVAGEQQRDLTASVAEQAQGRTQARPELATGRGGEESARLGPDQHADAAHSTRL